MSETETARERVLFRSCQDKDAEIRRLRAELTAAMDIAIVLNAEIEDDSSDILARLHHLLIMPKSECERITKIIRRAIREMIEPKGKT